MRGVRHVAPSTFGSALQPRDIVRGVRFGYYRSRDERDDGGHSAMRLYEQVRVVYTRRVVLYTRLAPRFTQQALYTPPCALGFPASQCPTTVSYTHLTLPTTPYV